MTARSVPVKTVGQMDTYIEHRTRDRMTVVQAAEAMGVSRRTGDRLEARWKDQHSAAADLPERITLKDAREHARLSIGVTAELLDVSKATVHYRENGERGLPPGELDRYAAIFAIPADRLIVPVRQAPDLNDPHVRGQLAQRMVPLATEFAGIVREENHEGIGRFLAALAPWEWPAFVVTLAAMVPDDRPVGDLLAWVTWDHPTRFPDAADSPTVQVA